MHWAEIPNLRHLRAVAAIAEYGSVSRASAEIHVSQPAVTQAIAKLESELGIVLFDRGVTGSFVTELGQLFVRRVDRFFEMAERAMDVLRDAYPDARGLQRSIEHIGTWRQIRYLIATTDPNAVEVRAREIGVSSASLYRLARELEQALEIQLFERSSFGVTMTEVGTQFARQLAVATREIEYGIEEVVAAQGRAAGSISIGVLPMSGSFAFGEAMNELMTRLPGIKIQIFDGMYLPLLGRLRSGQIDLIFGLLRGPESPSDVAEEELFADEFCVVVRKDHELTGLENPTTDDLVKYEWIASAPGTHRRVLIDQYFAAASSQPQFSVETSSLPVSRTLLACSDRVSILSQTEFELERRAGLLTSLPLTMGQGSPKGITTRANWLPTPSHDCFIQLLRFHTKNLAPDRQSAPRQEVGSDQFG